MTDVKDLMAKVGKIRILTNRLIDDQLAGDYHSTFKGQGVEFDEVRPYQVGDDVRTIDWNVTAKTGVPYIKRFAEERELTILFLVDVSGSQGYGSVRRSKMELAAEVTALLALTAIRNQDKIGLILFSDKIVKYIPPRKGRDAVMRLVREVLAAEDDAQGGTDIAGALKFLNGVQKRRAVVFLVSDFLLSSGTDWTAGTNGTKRPEDETGSARNGARSAERLLRATARHHDLIGVPVSDPAERALPDVGLVELEDPETGELVLVDTSSAAVRRAFAARAEAEGEELRKFFLKTGIETLPVATDRPYIDAVRALFRRRARKGALTRMACALLGFALAACPSLLPAATMDVSVTLKPGWNAVYVPVAPAGSADETFADWPVPSVSLYRAQAFAETRATTGGVTGESVTRAPFLAWTREAPAAASLTALTGDMVLVCCNTGATAYVAQLRGTPSAPRVAWHKSTNAGDTLNYVGIGMNPGAKVKASAWFAGCPAVRGGTFYKLSGAEDKPTVSSLAGFGATAFAWVTDGLAVLVAGASVSDWSGPLHVTPRVGIDFGDARTTDELAIRNDGAAEKTVELSLVPSLDGAAPPPLLVRDAAAALVNPDWQALVVNGAPLTRTLATGETWRVAVALDRTAFAGTGATRGAILRVAEVGGTEMRAHVPVSAQETPDVSAWPQGLWAIDLELDKVSRYVTDDTRVEGVKAGGKMKLRVYAHVAADGATHLLSRVTVAGTKKTGGTISRTAYGPQATLPTGLDYARRLTSAALPVDLAALAPTGGATWGQKQTFDYRIGASSPSNPFRHPLHPMFDGKDANFEPLPYDGDDFANYANAVKPELFSLGGQVVLEPDAATGTAWSPQETVTGACDWIYTGLMRQGPVKASGRFTAQRVIAGIELIRSL